jgi:hypothetical protein
MHGTNISEAVSPLSWVTRHRGRYSGAEEDTRRYWRKVWKRNRGKKAKTLRTHRKGK